MMIVMVMMLFSSKTFFFKLLFHFFRYEKSRPADSETGPQSFITLYADHMHITHFLGQTISASKSGWVKKRHFASLLHRVPSDSHLTMCIMMIGMVMMLFFFLKNLYFRISLFEAFL